MEPPLHSVGHSETLCGTLLFPKGKSECSVYAVFLQGASCCLGLGCPGAQRCSQLSYLQGATDLSKFPACYLRLAERPWELLKATSVPQWGWGGVLCLHPGHTDTS